MTTYERVIAAFNTPNWNHPPKEDPDANTD